jgi:peroxiredoxin
MADGQWRIRGLAVATIMASVLIAVLAIQKRELQERVAELWADAQLPQVGTYLPTLALATLDGDPVQLGQGNAPQILVVLTTTCPYCLASLPTWEALADSALTVGARFVGIVLDSVTKAVAYRQEHQLAFPLVVFEERRQRALYRAGTVPQTLVLDREGRVRHAAFGVFDRPTAVDSVLATVRLLQDEHARALEDSVRASPTEGS